MGRETHSVAGADSLKVVAGDMLEMMFGVGDAVVESGAIGGFLCESAMMRWVRLFSK